MLSNFMHCFYFQTILYKKALFFLYVENNKGLWVISFSSLSYEIKMT